MSNAKTPNLNEQLAELDKVLAWFEQSNIDLDEALVKFEEGTKLAETIKKRLNDVENKIVILKERFDKGVE